MNKQLSIALVTLSFLNLSILASDDLMQDMMVTFYTPCNKTKQNKVRQMLSKIDFQGNIEVREITPLARQVYQGRAGTVLMNNIRMMPLFGKNYLIIDGPWFDSLTEAEQQFVVAREGLRLKLGYHSGNLTAETIKVVLQLVCAIKVWQETKQNGALSFCKSDGWLSYFQRMATWTTASIAAYKSCECIANAHCRYQEYALDKETINWLNDNKIALEFLSNQASKEEKKVSNFSSFVPTYSERLSKIKK